MIACLNGARQPGDHPALPITPEQLADDAAACHAAGATGVHIHPRDASGAESLAAEALGAAVAAIRRRCPGLPIGVTTGLWITGGDAAARLALIDGWRELPAALLPDSASVNVSEDRFAPTVDAVLAAGVGTEAGFWPGDDARVLVGVPMTKVLIEVTRPGTAEGLLADLDRHGIGAPRQLHGEQRSCWPLIALAGRLGLETRVGLEDTLLTDDGTPTTGNPDLVRRAVRAWSP